MCHITLMLSTLVLGSAAMGSNGPDLTGVRDLDETALACVDLTAALPDRQEMAGFEIRRAYLVPRPEGSDSRVASASFLAVRQRDLAYVRLSVYVHPNADRVTRHVHGARTFGNTDARMMETPEGCPLDRRIGRKTWSPHRGAGPFMGGLRILAQDGNAVIRVSLGLQPGRSAGGGVVQPSVTDDEAKLVVDITQRCMDRLTAMGYTSRPAKQAAPWARKQVEERLRKAKADPKQR